MFYNLLVGNHKSHTKPRCHNLGKAAGITYNYLCWKCKLQSCADFPGCSSFLYFLKESRLYLWLFLSGNCQNDSDSGWCCCCGITFSFSDRNNHSYPDGMYASHVRHSDDGRKLPFRCGICFKDLLCHDTLLCLYNSAGLLPLRASRHPHWLMIYLLSEICYNEQCVLT